MSHFAMRVLALSMALWFVQAPLAAASGMASNRDHLRPSSRPEQAEVPTPSGADIVTYISAAWDVLTRSTSECAALADPKTDGETVLYLPLELTIPPAMEDLEKRCHVRIDHLPGKITTPGGIDMGAIRTEGLLYLPHPYVVPGGQFNEMYGWDSYFIILGLLRDHRLAFAKGMVENFFFEIEHYGGILNANRTYYLTRSQPPFLSSMVLAIYNAEKESGKEDTSWLTRAYAFVARDYDQWNQPPHLAGDSGLSRYFDHGNGPVPEIMGDPSQYYHGVAQFFAMHGGQDAKYLVPVDPNQSTNQAVGPTFALSVCDSRSGQSSAADCSPSARFALSEEFYKGDRSMRESGFDVTFRFGPFGAETHHYAPVCLNSLLFKAEKDLEEMSRLLGKREDTVRWHNASVRRQQEVDKLLWNVNRGLYFDYNFVSQSQSSYEYATTFYPLWAGLASAVQARRVAQNISLFEQRDGLAMSRYESEAQWDYPYGWAPVELLAVEGLRRYGYRAEGDRVAYAFLRTVLLNYRLDHTIREKYDVVNGSEQTRIAFGYAQNFTGFGWTNGVFLELLHSLPAGWAEKLRKE